MISDVSIMTDYQIDSIQYRDIKNMINNMKNMKI
jgi:hypothetical protein